MTTARRAELLDLAQTLLEREGVDRFGINSLARAAGIKPPSLYKHFDGLDDVHDALISRGFAAYAEAMTDAAARAGGDAAASVREFADAYRRHALDAPQLYLLMTTRPLRRDAIEPGSEQTAQAGLLALFGEDEARHDVSRAAWAWAHGLVTLEIAERFPPGADLDAAWSVLVETLTARLPETSS